MKRLFWILPIIVFLGGCSTKKQMINFIDIDFSGMDTQGTASYTVNTEQLYKEVFNYDEEIDFMDEKMQNELYAFEDSYKLKLSKDKNLSNGDKVKVIVSVDNSKTKKIKGGEKDFTVTGLVEPKKLTSKEVMDNLVVNFTGASGRGTATIENIFDEPLGSVKFAMENDGKLKNGDKATIKKSNELEQDLRKNGYILANDFNPQFEVNGLENVVENAKDLANLEDITRMIDEQVKRKYKDSEYSFGYKYEINLNKLMYRQFAKDDTDENYNWFGSNSSNNGNLIGIYSIKEYSAGTESKLNREFTSIIGYSNIIVDDNKQANVANIKEISDTKDDTYSLESVLKLFEGYGYTELLN